MRVKERGAVLRGSDQVTCKAQCQIQSTFSACSNVIDGIASPYRGELVWMAGGLRLRPEPKPVQLLQDFIGRFTSRTDDIFWICSVKLIQPLLHV